MTIYTSEKVMPYVYMGIHKHTGEFYIGSRANTKQRLPSHLDLFQYRTSSKYVKPRFDEFNWHIVAECLTPHDAYVLEQQLIYEQWNNPLSLNYSCFHNGKQFSRVGSTLSARHRERFCATGRQLPKELIEKRTATRANNKNVTWMCTSPTGEVIHTTTLVDICRQYNLDPSTMRRVALGKFNQHKGWLCQRHSTQ